ncbi:MAG: shikimate kinase [Muribaculaceae bacterium]|nr:shikimate kinase [Muribaculaceae bacterium]
MKPVFLIGYMGCGKSTLGRALQKHSGLDFIDLDHYIENRFHATISELFASRGEEGFRRIEAAMLDEVSQMTDVVIACGGGTPCFFNNMDLMNERGLTVWLTTPLPRLFERLQRNRAKRPILADKTDEELMEFITRALEERKPYYSRAHAQFCATLLEDKSQITITAQEFATKFLK